MNSLNLVNLGSCGCMTPGLTQDGHAPLFGSYTVKPRSPLSELPTNGHLLLRGSYQDDLTCTIKLALGASRLGCAIVKSGPLCMCMTGEWEGPEYRFSLYHIHRHGAMYCVTGIS